jgi:hypothetical protein
LGSLPGKYGALHWKPIKSKEKQTQRKKEDRVTRKTGGNGDKSEECAEQIKSYLMAFTHENTFGDQAMVEDGSTLHVAEMKRGKTRLTDDDEEEGAAQKTDQAKRKYLGRFLSLPEERNISRIWSMAEEKLGIDRGLFCLVNQSHYLPESGVLEKTVQIWEVRIRGRAGGRPKPEMADIRKREKFSLEVEGNDDQSWQADFDVENLTEAKVREIAEELTGFWNIYIHFRRGEKRIRLTTGQELHGGNVYAEKETSDLNYVFCAKIENEWITVDLNEYCGHADEGLKYIKENFTEQAQVRGTPRLWRGLRQIHEWDIIGGEILTLDWTDQKRTCKIRVGGETFKTVVDDAGEIIRHIEMEYGLRNLYMCDNETGYPVDYRTDFDGGEFTVYQAFNRTRMNRAVWPGEEGTEKVIDGVGADIRAWIANELGCWVELWVIREGLIPVCKELEDYKHYTDTEFLIKPLGEVYKPENKNWKLFPSIRDPGWRDRTGYKRWKEEEDKKNEFITNWFARRESKESQEFHQKVQEKVNAALQEWSEIELQNWSIEESDPKEIRRQGKEMAKEALDKCASKYLFRHEDCQILSLEQFLEETYTRWRREHGGRIDYLIAQYQGQWTERRQAMLTEEVERIDKAKSMVKAEHRWENLLTQPEFKAVDTSVIKRQAREIRANNLKVEDQFNIAQRIVRYLEVNQRLCGGEKRSDVLQHLEMYRISKKVS